MKNTPSMRLILGRTLAWKHNIPLGFGFSLLLYYQICDLILMTASSPICCCFWRTFLSPRKGHDLRQNKFSKNNCVSASFSRIINREVAANREAAANTFSAPVISGLMSFLWRLLPKLLSSLDTAEESILKMAPHVFLCKWLTGCFFGLIVQVQESISSRACWEHAHSRLRLTSC